MTKLAGSTTIRCLLSGALVIAATSRSQSPRIAEQIAETYGLDSFGQIDAIRYTFNLQFPGLKSLPFTDLGARDRPSLLREKR